MQETQRLVEAKYLALFLLISVLVVAGYVMYKSAQTNTLLYTLTDEVSAKTEYSQMNILNNDLLTTNSKSPALDYGFVRHLKTPDFVRGVYITSWVAGAKNSAQVFARRNAIIDLANETEVNAVVIDIKDDTGRISFLVKDPYLKGIGSAQNRISDIQQFISQLHENNIYVIGRVSVFQDPYFVKVRPDLAVKSRATGEVWHDKNGLTWLDAASTEVWDYVIAIARESYKFGFDEIQFDYVRFPSDGNVIDISYPFFSQKTKEIETTIYEERIVPPNSASAGEAGENVVKVPITKVDIVSMTRRDQMREFYNYMGKELLGEIPISVDLFGYTTTNKDDLGVGQVIEDAAKNFNYVSPMVYPSHYNQNAYGFGNPNEHPGEIVLHSLSVARERMEKIGEGPDKIRAWLQDFDYPVHYSAEDVRAQISSVYKAGMNSWLLWDPANTYTKSALEGQERGLEKQINTYSDMGQSPFGADIQSE